MQVSPGSSSGITSTTTVTSRADGAGVEMPQTDEERLFFYAELCIANIPSLISELNSARNTLWSISEKKRTEIKAKTQTIQTLSGNYTALLNAIKELREVQAAAAARQRQIASEMNPVFMTTADLEREAQESYYAEGKSSEAESGNAGSKGEDERNVVHVDDETSAKIREAEAELESLKAQQQNCDELIQALQEQLKESETSERELQQIVADVTSKTRTERETLSSTRALVEVTQLILDEALGRKTISDEERGEWRRMLQLCEAEEIPLLQDATESQVAMAESHRREAKERREQQEVEGATFDAAVLTEKATAEELHDRIEALRQSQNQLERYAKQQQLEETDRNSLRKRFLSRSSKKIIYDDITQRVLTPEQEDEIRRDHQLVAELCARIAAMEKRRNEAAGVLAQHQQSSSADERIIQQLREIIDDEIHLVDDAIRTYDEDTQCEATRKLDFN